MTPKCTLFRQASRMHARRPDTRDSKSVIRWRFRYSPRCTFPDSGDAVMTRGTAAGRFVRPSGHPHPTSGRSRTKRPSTTPAPTPTLDRSLDVGADGMPFPRAADPRSQQRRMDRGRPARERRTVMPRLLRTPCVATSPSLPMSTTARRRSSIHCCGRAGPSAPINRWPSG